MPSPLVLVGVGAGVIANAFVIRSSGGCELSLSVSGAIDSCIVGRTHDGQVRAGAALAPTAFILKKNSLMDSEGRVCHWAREFLPRSPPIEVFIRKTDHVVEQGKRTHFGVNKTSRPPQALKSIAMASCLTTARRYSTSARLTLRASTTCTWLPTNTTVAK